MFFFSRLGVVAVLMVTTEATSSAPPGFPPTWSGIPIANYTMVGYDAGKLNVQFSSDCSAGPSAQRVLTVYPDKYTVITRCDQGWNYILDPKSRGSGCALWPVQDDTCQICACPFCLRDSYSVWGSAGLGAVTWTSNETSTSPLTGDAVVVWRGTQANGNNVAHAVSVASGLPVSQIVTSPNYLTIGTFFANFTSGVPAGAFDVPAKCPSPPIRSMRMSSTQSDGAATRTRTESGSVVHQPSTTEVRGGISNALVGVAIDGGATMASTAVSGSSFPDGVSAIRSAPPLGTQFSAKLLTNISQPGYEGGNVLTVVTADCSEGAGKQRVHTTYGNFHTVLVDCAAGLVYNYDLAGIGCSTVPIGVQTLGVSARVCDACALPFGIRDTGGEYRTGNASTQVFSWSSPVVGHDDASTYRGHEGSLELNFTFARNGTPLVQHTMQPGWQSVIVTFSNYSVDIDTGIFALPVCFTPLAMRYAQFWAGWLWMTWAALSLVGILVTGRLTCACVRRQRAHRQRGIVLPQERVTSSEPFETGASAARRSVLTVVCIACCYVCATTFEAPQVVQSNQLPYSFEKPTLAGGGYCYTPPCDAFSGTFKPPWWHNPTHVVGTTPNTMLVSVYYGYLMGMALLGVAIQHFPATNRHCRRRILLRRPLPWPSYCDTSVGEFASVLSLLALLVFYFSQTGSLLHERGTRTMIKDLATMSGLMLNIQIGLTLLPIARALSHFGVTLERALVFHRVFGVSVVLVGGLHVTLQHLNWVVQGTYMINLLHYVDEHTGQDVWPWVIPMMEIVFLGVLAAALTACGPIRRSYYLLFVSLHVVVMPVFIVATLLHSWSAWKYSIIGLALYVGDKLDQFLAARLQTHWPTVRLISMRVLSGGVVALRLHSRRKPMPGTTIRLKIPAVSCFQWHPFTVSETGSSFSALGALSPVLSPPSRPQAKTLQSVGKVSATQPGSRYPVLSPPLRPHADATPSGTADCAALKFDISSDPGQARGDGQKFVDSTDGEEEPQWKTCLQQEDELSPQQIAWLEAKSARPMAVKKNEDLQAALDTVVSGKHTEAASPDRTWTLHVKATGTGRWTDSLLKLASGQVVDAWAVRVQAFWSDEPHIQVTNAALHHASLMIAGGVGITPISALASRLLGASSTPAPTRAGKKTTHTTLMESVLLEDFADCESISGTKVGSSVCLVWVVRSVELVLEFVPLLEALLALSSATLRIHITRSAESNDHYHRLPLWLQPYVFHGRPDVDMLLAEHGCVDARTHVNVYASGPPELERAIGLAREAYMSSHRGASVHLTQLTFQL